MIIGAIIKLLFVFGLALGAVYLVAEVNVRIEEAKEEQEQVKPLVQRLWSQRIDKALKWLDEEV